MTPTQPGAQWQEKLTGVVIPIGNFLLVRLVAERSLQKKKMMSQSRVLAATHAVST